MSISFHYNEKGKYSSAVYRCDVKVKVTEEWITKLFPRAYGRNITAYAIADTAGSTRFHLMVVSTKQTTPSDIIYRLEKVLTRDGYDVKPEVTLLACVHTAGRGNYPGSPRKGTKRVRPNAPRGTAVAAK